MKAVYKKDPVSYTHLDVYKRQVYTNTLAGIRETDARLLEMAAVFRVPPAKRGDV